MTAARNRRPPLHVLTFNVHKGYCSGNRRFMLGAMRERIAASGADIVFLQEIHGHAEKSRRKQRRASYPEQPHFEYLADQAWPHYAYGCNAIYRKGDHGNAILSMHPFSRWENIDVALFPRSSRSILHGVIDIPGYDAPLHTLCVHLGLLERERRLQMRTLVERIEQHVPRGEPMVIAGDFNDWRMQAEKHLKDELGLRELFVQLTGRHARTFPVWAPVFPVDRIYYRGLEPVSCSCLADGPWRELSDHAALYGVLR